MYAPLGFHLKKEITTTIFLEKEEDRLSKKRLKGSINILIDWLFCHIRSWFWRRNAFLFKDIVHKCNVETDLNDQLHRLASDKSISTHDKVSDLVDEMRKTRFYGL